MTASSICLVQNGAGPFVGVTGGVNVDPGNTISVQLQNTTDVTQWALQIFGLDEVTATAPSLTDVNPTTHIVTSPSAVVTFPMPSGAGIGRTLLFRSSVNGGGSGFTTTFGIYTLTADGFRVGAVGEKFEGDTDFGWASTVNAIIRTGGGGGGTLGDVTIDATLSTANDVPTTIHSYTVTGSGRHAIVYNVDLSCVTAFGGTATFKVAATFDTNNAGASISQRNVTILNGPFRDDPAVDIDFDVVGSNINLQVIGSLTQPQKWRAYGYLTVVSNTFAG